MFEAWEVERPGGRGSDWKGALGAGWADGARGGAALGESTRPLSDPRPAVAGELYDLDASSLQLKVLQYVSP